MIKCLIVEDNLDDVDLIVRRLKKSGLEFEYSVVETELGFRSEIFSNEWDIILSDFTLPDLDGFLVLDIINNNNLDIPFILVSGTIGELQAVELMKRGAGDYILKDNLSRLAPAVNRELKESVIRKREKTALAKMLASENRLKILFQNMSKGVALLNYDNDKLLIKDINPVAEKILKMLGIFEFFSCSNIEVNDQNSVIFSDLQYVATSGEFIQRTLTREVDGIINLWINYDITKIPNKDIVIFFEDISDSKRHEREIEHNLMEKELMLHEIHHRVKNNMQIIISLLRLKRKYFSDEFTADKFKEIQDQIRAMSLVHENLYQSNDFVNVEMKSYIHSLSSDLLNDWNQMHNIKMMLEIGDISMNMEKVIPCGLILNELMTNTIKHAYEGIESKEKMIRIRMIEEQDGRINLSYHDNGKGWVPELKNPTKDNFGMQLVNILANKQLHGETTYSQTDGFNFTVIFNPIVKESIHRYPNK